MNSFSTFACQLLIIIAANCAFQTVFAQSVEEYLLERNELVLKDDQRRFSADILLDSAEYILENQLFELRQRMMGVYSAEGFFPPRGNFLKYKNQIDTSLLFSIFQEMPKGGILHLHPSAAVDFRWLIDTIMTMSEAYVCWEGETCEKGSIRFFSNGKNENGFEPLSEMQKSVPHISDSLYQYLTFDREEIDRDSFDIWDEFERVFARLTGIYAYKPLYKPYLRNVMDNLRKDNIQHVEIRTILNGGFYDLTNGLQRYGLDTSVKILNEFVHDYEESYPGFTIKSIFTDLRFKDSVAIRTAFEQAYATRAKYPDLIKGFDLVANEDDGNTTLYFISSWIERKKFQEKYNINMPMYLHDGESDWAHIKNLYDAVVLDCKRIGHGFNLMFFPSLVAAVVENDIALEVSPLSNQILDYVQDLRMHPANAMMRHGVQLTISSDDPAIFGYQGTSYDYWSIFLAWELSLADIKKMVFNSIQYSALNPDEKSRSIAILEKSWKEFINNAINTLSAHGY